MKNNKENNDKSMTLGELFELAGCPLRVPEANNTKRKRRPGKSIVIKLAPGSENWHPDPDVLASLLMQAIDRNAEALYKATNGNLPMGPGKRPRKMTLAEIKIALSFCFQRTVEERLKGNTEKEK